MRLKIKISLCLRLRSKFKFTAKVWGKVAIVFLNISFKDKVMYNIKDNI
jgi:hypothetical protein